MRLQEQYRKVVAGAACNHKQMPDAVAPWVPVVEHKEYDAARVENAASN